MLKSVAFTLVMSFLAVGLASARHDCPPLVSPGDTTTYYLDGKVISSENFTKLDPKVLVSIHVDKGAGTVKGYTGGVTTSTEPYLYQSKGTKIDWSAARVLRDVSFIVDDKVTDAQKARLITADQIESVYQLPASATGPNGEAGSFGKNGVLIITTRKK